MNGTLTLPTYVLIAAIRKYRDQLSERFYHIEKETNDSITSSQQTANIPKPSGSGVNTMLIKPRPTQIIPLKPYRKRIDFPKVVVSVVMTK